MRRRPRPRPAAPGSVVPYALQTLIDELTLRAGRRCATASAARDRAADDRRRGRTSASRSARRDDLHAALRAAHVRRQLRLPGGELPAVARARRCSSALRELAARAAGARSRPRREALPPPRDTVSVHVVEASGGRPRACACARVTRAGGATGGSAAESSRPAPGRRGRAAARARAGSRRAARCRPSAASTPTTCSRSSSGAATTLRGGRVETGVGGARA